MIRTLTLEADLATIPSLAGIAPRTVVALPPSDADPTIVVGGTVYDALTTYDASTVYGVTYAFEQMRVYVNGTLTLRAYDPDATQVTPAINAPGTYGSYEGGY